MHQRFRPPSNEVSLRAGSSWTHTRVTACALGCLLAACGVNRDILTNGGPAAVGSPPGSGGITLPPGSGGSAPDASGGSGAVGGMSGFGSGGSSGTAGWNMQGGTGGTCVPDVSSGSAGATMPSWTAKVPADAPPVTDGGPLSGVWYGAVDLSTSDGSLPPLDELTVSLDSSGVHSLAFQRLNRQVSIIAPGVVSPHYVDRTAIFDADSVTPTSFTLGYHGGPELWYLTLCPGVQLSGMLTETLTGTLDDTGRLLVNYTLDGEEQISSIHATATGLLNKQGSPNAVFTDLHGRWYGLVTVSGDTTFDQLHETIEQDQMSIAFDDGNGLRILEFQDVPLPALSFGADTSTFPQTGTRVVAGAEMLATVESFNYSSTAVSLHMHVQNAPGSQYAGTDYVVGLDGQLSAAGLTISYTWNGSLTGVTRSLTGTGTLRP